MGLHLYINDEEVISTLTEYEEIKIEIICLKYKVDHELVGLKNGNRPVKMVLDKPLLPYSMKIGGKCCRLIHNKVPYASS